MRAQDTRDRRRILRWATLVGTIVASAGAAGARCEAQVATYQAHYRTEYRGYRVGTTVMSLTYDASRQEYRFETRMEVAGLLRFVRPNASRESTRFVLHGDAVRPLEYEYGDGSRSGDQDLQVTFDWNRGVATAEPAGTAVPLEAGMLNAGTVLIALMRDAVKGVPVGPYVLTDGQSQWTYRYIAGNRESAVVEAGEFETVVFEQLHQGSSRRTVYWLAPALEYLPVKIVQYRNDEARLTLLLESVDGLGTPVVAAEEG